MFDAQRGSKLQADTFRDMGIEIEGANGQLRPVSEIFAEIADRAREMNGSTELAGELMTLMGRSGSGLTNMLIDGSEGLEDFADRLHELNGVMGEDALRASEEYEDALLDLKISVDGLKREIGSEFIPVITLFTQHLTDDAIPAARKFFKEIDDGGLAVRALAFAAKNTTLGLIGTALFGKLSEAKAASDELERQKAILDDMIVGPPQVRSGSGDVAPRPGKPEKLILPKPIKFSKEVMDSIRTANGVLPRSDIKEQLDAQLEELEVAAQNREALRQEELERIRAFEQAKADAARVTADAQQALANEVFMAVSTFASLGQQAVEQSEFGKTRAGRAAAKALFAASKVAAIAQAAVNTALAISNTLATVQPPPAAAAAAAAMGVAAAAQIGVIVGTTIQGLADAGLAPGVLRDAGLNNHTVVAMRNDEAIIDPVGTSEITQMLGIQRRFMEMELSGRRSMPTQVNVNLDGRRVSKGLLPHQATLAEDGYRFDDDVRGAA